MTEPEPKPRNWTPESRARTPNHGTTRSRFQSQKLSLVCKSGNLTFSLDLLKPVILLPDRFTIQGFYQHFLTQDLTEPMQSPPHVVGGSLCPHPHSLTSWKHLLHIATRRSAVVKFSGDAELCCVACDQGNSIVKILSSLTSLTLPPSSLVARFQKSMCLIPAHPQPPRSPHSRALCSPETAQQLWVFQLPVFSKSNALEDLSSELQISTNNSFLVYPLDDAQVPQIPELQETAMAPLSQTLTIPSPPLQSPGNHSCSPHTILHTTSLPVSSTLLA